MSDLPAGWVETTLGEVVDYGQTEKVEPRNIPANAWILELEDIEKDTSRLLQRLTFKQRESKSTKNAFKKDDVLYGKLRPYLNKVIIADKDGYCTTEIIPIKPNKAIDGRYLFYWLKNPEFLSYVNSVSYGLNMPRLGTKDGLAAPLVLAPLPEQKRIAEKLDSLLARVDSCQTHLERVPQILKRFRQSVLAAATSGRLTEDWREKHSKHNGKTAKQQVAEILADREKKTKKPSESHLIDEEFDIPEGWLWVSLDSLSSQIVDGTHFTPKYIDEGIPFISVKDIQNGKIDFSDTRFISQSEHLELSKRCKPEVGDLLITKSGTIGRMAMVTTDTEFSLFVSVALLKPASKLVNMRFIEIGLESWINSIDVSSRIVGSTIKNLHIRDMRVLAIPFPSLEEQAEIVRRVERLFAYAERLEVRYASASEHVGRLSPSLLGKAFRGELVEQESR